MIAELIVCLTIESLRCGSRCFDRYTAGLLQAMVASPFPFPAPATQAMRGVEMAAFKLPSLSTEKAKRDLELVEFSWNPIVIKEELGSGTFGSVYFANFNIAGEPRCVVVKKSKGESAETKRRFEKEAGILD